MMNEQIIAAIRDIKSATRYIDEVVDRVVAELDEQPAQAAAPQPEPQPQLKLEDVRAVLADKSRAGYTAQVRELLTKYGASKLSAVDPANYAALLADAEVLDNG